MSPHLCGTVRSEVCCDCCGTVSVMSHPVRILTLSLDGSAESAGMRGWAGLRASRRWMVVAILTAHRASRLSRRVAGSAPRCRSSML